MTKCGIVEKKKGGKKTPPCPEILATSRHPTHRCPIHCRVPLRGERKGRFCPNHHVKGRHGCRMHGGSKKAKIGLAAPNYKNGEYSRYVQVLDPKLAKRYRALEANPDYLSLSPDILAAQTLIDEYVLRARQGESAGGWKKARQAFDNFMTAQEANDRGAMVTALTELRQTLHAGDTEREAWEEVQKLWMRLQRLVESERRRAIEHGQLVALPIVLSILRTSADSFRRHIAYAQLENALRDTILGRVSIDLNRITGGALSGVLTAGKPSASGESS